jgi:hypothetical protein
MPEGRTNSTPEGDCWNPSRRVVDRTIAVLCVCVLPLFPVHFVGELVSCTGFLPPRLSLTPLSSYSSLSAHWAIETREERHWRHLEGDVSGKTWLAQREQVSTQPAQRDTTRKRKDVPMQFSADLAADRHVLVSARAAK